MIISLDRLTTNQQRNSIERAERLAPTVTVTERGDGFVRADVECNGSCGARQYHGGLHDVVLRWDGIMTCSCPTVHSICYHAAALLAHESGVFPDAPKSCEQRGCGGSLMYWDNGNGHAASCPLVDDPEARYEAPQSEAAKRIARGALQEPTRWGERLQERLKDVEFAQEFAAQPAAIAGGRQRTIDKTRPTIAINDGDLRITRGCGHLAFSARTANLNALIGSVILPLSPFEGCPDCGDSMTPPAPDQVRARQEGV